jgi:hypothetical protein
MWMGFTGEVVSLLNRWLSYMEIPTSKNAKSARKST